MKRMILTGMAILMGIGAGIAADDPIQARKALLNANGNATKTVVPFLKGAAPFKLETVQAALKQFIETSDKAASLFPPGSDQGKTGALPAIWKNKSDFDARMAKLGTDAKTALAAIKDEASFKANFPPIFKDCGGCHETYRAKEQ